MNTTTDGNGRSCKRARAARWPLIGLACGVMAGCTATRRMDQDGKEAAQEAIEEAPEAPEREAASDKKPKRKRPPSDALRVGILRVEGQPTDNGGFRWVGRARISGSAKTKHSAVIKTRCTAPSGPVTEITYPSIDGGVSTLGVPSEGMEFQFSGMGSANPLARGDACEMRFVLIDHESGQSVPTRSALACFSDDVAAVGPCDSTALGDDRAEPTFRILDTEVEGASVRFTARLHEQRSGVTAFFVKATCWHDHESRREEWTRGLRAWGLMRPGEAATDTAIFSSDVVSRARACRFDFAYGPWTEMGEDPGVAAQHTMCWAQDGDGIGCEALR